MGTSSKKGAYMKGRFVLCVRVCVYKRREEMRAQDEK